MQKLENILSKLGTGILYLSMSFLFIMMTLGAIDVLARYVFNAPILGVAEVFELLLPAIVLLGLSYAQMQKAHIKVDIIYNRFTGRTKDILQFASLVMAFVLLAAVMWQGTLTTISYFEQGRVLRSIAIPMFIPQMLVPFGAFLYCMVLIVDLSNLFRSLRKE